MSGPMVIMITEILKDMMVFSFLFLLVVIGFGVAFYVLFNLDPGPDKETDGFDTIWSSLLSMFTLMLGDFELDVCEKYWPPLSKILPRAN